MNVGFLDLENAFDSEPLWVVLRMYDVGGKLSNGITSMYVNSSACERYKRRKGWERVI